LALLISLIACLGLVRMSAIGQGQTSACQQALQPIQNELNKVTADLYGSAKEQVDKFNDLSVDALEAPMRAVALAVKVADGVSKVSAAVLEGLPRDAVIKSLDPILQSLRIALNEKERAKYDYILQQRSNLVKSAFQK
jgi:hypothetical protein